MSTDISNITVTNKTGSNIALLELANPIRYSDYIQPVCMDLAGTRAFPTGTQCWVAGWGHGTNTRGDAGSVLRDLDTNVTSCGNNSENICTYAMDIEQGDKGGPLLCQSDSSWFQVAVVTMDDTRADIQVFAKVSQFGSFLKETVGDLPTPPVKTTGNAAFFSVSVFLSFTVPILSMLLVTGL